MYAFSFQENSAQKEVDDLIQEMKIMQEIGSHPHVVTILGVCTEQGENYYLANTLSNPGHLRSSPATLPGQIQSSIKYFMAG